MAEVAELGKLYMWRVIFKRMKPLSRPAGKRGFTFIELLMVCMIISILAGIGIGAFHVVMAKAYIVTLKYDLQTFVKAQEAYTGEYGRYLGAAGDFIQWGRPPSGPLAVPGFPFAPSEGVRVEITSGDGQTYMGPPPFKAAARHERSNVYFEYDFSARITTERQG
jgi:prepilin-type N-terminal cleavage/methylation domain-containing protein